MTQGIEDSETGLLAAVLIQPSTLDMIQAEVSPTDFANGDLGRVFALLCDAYDAGKPIDDARTTVSELRAANLLDAVGGVTGLATILQNTPNGSAAVYHAKRVRKAATLRKVAALGRTMVAACDNPTADPIEIIQRIDALAAQVRAADDRRSVVTIEQATREAIERMKEAKAGRNAAAIPTGFRSLDEAISGFYRGELIILAARPSIGKSAFAAQVASHNARVEKNATLLVSLEMDAASIATRDLAAALHVEVREIRSGIVDSSQMDDAETYANELVGVPLNIHYGRTATVAQIRGLARLMQAQPSGLSMAVVDYLGLLAATDRRRPRWEQVSEISADLKTLAQELDIPVLACCQLGRDAEGKAPTLAQLRDSGAIEQDADVVLLLHRESRDAELAELNVAKNRNGATGSINLRFFPETTSFADMGWDL